METIINICSILFFIGLFTVLFSALLDYKEDAIVAFIGTIVMFVSVLIALVIVFVTKPNEPEPPKYFPESEYSLEYIVTEFDGKIDTTYVIIPKE